MTQAFESTGNHTANDEWMMVCKEWVWWYL